MAAVVGLVLTLIGVIAGMYLGVMGSRASNRQEKQDREEFE